MRKTVLFAAAGVRADDGAGIRMMRRRSRPLGATPVAPSDATTVARRMRLWLAPRTVGRMTARNLAVPAVALLLARGGRRILPLLTA